MKRYALLTAAILIAATPCFAEKVIVGQGGEELAVRVLESNDQRVLLEFEIGGFERDRVEIEGDVYYTVSLDGESNILEKGLPELPNVCRSIVIPDDARMGIKVLSSEFEEIANFPVAPSKGVFDRTINPADVPYTFDSFYGESGWYPGEEATARAPYILRDFRGLTVVVNPFRYDPSTNTLRVYTKMVVEVRAEGPGVENVLTFHHRDSMNSEFFRIYQEQFVNFDAFRYTPVGEAGEMLIITYDAFHADMVPLVNWKNQMGVKTTIVDVSVVGNNSTSIKNYIQNFYNTTDLAFVLLVGDAAQIAYIYASGGASDPSYSLVAGSDNYPDIFIGRFSASTNSHVQTQVERTITYEQNPMAGADWYHKGMGVASNQGPGDDGEYDNVHMDNIRADLLGFTYTYVDQIYDPTANATQVANGLNDGRSIINYTGHGSTTAWSSSGFSVTHVNALANNSMLPFIVSVACVNGDFTYSTCFAEAWLRATNGGVPTGAIGMYASTINQSWNSPMCGQDEVNDLLVAEEKRTFGALCFNGSCQMMDEYGTDGVNMFKTWHVFGDPSVRVRTDTPSSLTVSHADNVESASTTFDVSVPGVEGALCGLSYNNTFLGSGFTDGSGSAAITIDGTLPEGEDIVLTVSGFNAFPYVGTVHVGPNLYPTCDISPAEFVLDMGTDETRTEYLTLENNGDAGSMLTYTIEIVDEVTVREISGSTFEADLSGFDPGSTFDVVFTITGQTTDNEWIKYAALDFPAGVVVNSSTNFLVVGSATRSLDTDGSTGDGATINWAADGSWGEIYPGESARATVNLTATAGFVTDMLIPWMLHGDDYGSEPHQLTGTITIDVNGPEILVQAPNGGEVWGIDEVHGIQWASNMVDFVDIEYCNDGGGSWIPVVSGTPSDGFFEWLVPAPKSTDCLVRIIDAGSPALDMSDSAFTVYQPITWMSATPDFGEVAAGGQAMIQVDFDTEGLGDGDYLATMIIHNNAGSDQYVTVVLTVSSVNADPDYSTIAVNDDLMLAPDGNGDSTMTVVVTVKDEFGIPIQGVPAGLVSVSAVGASSLGQDFHFCASGSNTATFHATDPTDANGQTTILVSEAGGCGTVALSATVGSVAVTGNAVTNVRSPDFNGDGIVNYFDTFLYIPMLSTATGYCGNLNGSGDGVVNFFDTAKYLPYLANGVQCP